MKLVLLAVLLLLLFTRPAVRGATARKTPAQLDRDEFRDKVYACWLGKNIGGTLGMPFEGQREMHSLTFYDPVPEKPAANDDLDLQILWLKALEERGPKLDARVLGEYWLKYVPVDWNEYGIGKANMRDGFPPPLSGHFRNKWRDSNGAWIRSEIWACVAPGCPALAARYAWEDACVDHGTAEGTWAEVFMAAIESAAFVEPDRDRLLEIGLSYIPGKCSVAKSIRAAMDTYKQGLDLKAARAAVVKASESTGWFMAPQNVAFVVLGWLYGEGDFGKSICAAVDCGDDTDCTGATLGSILGIIHGSEFIPDKWRKPVGEGIQNVAISGFQPPATLSELTDHTVRMAERVLEAQHAPVTISAEPRTAPLDNAKLRLVDRATAKELWARSPYQLAYDFGRVRAVLDLLSEPEIVAGSPRPVSLRIENLTEEPVEVSVTWQVPEKVSAKPERSLVRLPAAGSKTCRATLTSDAAPGARLAISVVLSLDDGSTVFTVPVPLCAP